MFCEKFRTIQYLESILSRNLGIKNIKKEIDLQFNLPIYSQEILDKIILCAKKYISCNYEPIVSISADGLNLKSEDLENFIELEYELQKEGVSLFLTEGRDKYSLIQTINAYVKCKRFADFVKSTNTSPFEKYLMIYGFVSDRIYKESEGDLSGSRNLISILNSEEIVCVGYAKLLKYLCNEVGIECECQVMDVVYEGEKEIGKHQNNIVYLKDEKYGIDGCYYADACWDAVNKNELPCLKYTYALVPVGDVEKMESKYFNFDVTNFLYNEYSEVEFLEDANKLKTFAKFMNIPYESKPINEENENYAEYFDRLGEYMMAIHDLLKENKIPADILSPGKFDKIPRRFFPEFLVAMALLEPPRTDIIEQSIKEMKEFYKTNGAISKKSDSYRLYESYGYEDIYEKLKEHERIDSIFNIWDLESYYEVYHNLPKIKFELEKIKKSSVPIDKLTFAKALCECFKVQDLNEEQAKIITSAALEKTERLSKDAFLSGATNCFMNDEKIELTESECE